MTGNPTPLISRFIPPHFALALPLLAGCLQTGPALEQGGPETAVLEPVRMAGATSSTNWPVQEGGDSIITLSGDADTAIRIDFLLIDIKTPVIADTGYRPVRVRGMATLFDGSGIAPLRNVDSVNLMFDSTEALYLPARLLDSLPHHGRDTVVVNLRVTSDSMKCLVTGFIYDRVQRRFLQTPFSVNPPSSYYLAVPEFGFSAQLDTAGVSSMFPPVQGSEWSFYIPGTPHYWSPESSTPILLDRIPKGIFPIRLLHLQPLGQDSDSTRVDIYEVTVTRFIPGQNGQPHQPPVFRIGEKVLSTELPGRVEIRPLPF